MAVPVAGLEPASLAAGDFESPVSTNSTTRAIRARGVRRAAGSGKGQVATETSQSVMPGNATRRTTRTMSDSTKGVTPA